MVACELRRSAGCVAAAAGLGASAAVDCCCGVARASVCWEGAFVGKGVDITDCLFYIYISKAVTYCATPL